MTETVPFVSIDPARARRTASAVGLTVLAHASRPGPDCAGEPKPIPGFVLSPFSPLVADVAERCLSRHYGDPPVDPAKGERTAVVVASVTGDVTTAAAVAKAVDDGTRVWPLLFYQSVPNSVAGHIASRWGLAGPLVCASPSGDPLADGLALASLLLADGDAREVLLVVAESGDRTGDNSEDKAIALLVAAGARPASG